MSRAFSTLGLLCLVIGIMLFPAAEAGETVLRWHWLLGGLTGAALCFWLAAKTGAR